jgi:hypothetical protein
VRTSFVYCLAVKDEVVKIIRSNLHFLLWLCTRFSFVNQCSLWYYYLVIICDMWWTIWSCLIVKQFVILCKEICDDYYFANQSEIIRKRIRIEMKSINTDAWLVNFILSFSGISPILIAKSQFYSITWHRRPQQCAHLLDSTQQKRARPNQISSKKATIEPNKIFFGLYEQR